MFERLGYTAAVIRSLSPAVAPFLLLTAALSQRQPTQRRVFVTGADGNNAVIDWANHD